ncbi:tRNA (adenosine(37)-N6)-threonylcarbamoyltransferase complex transferase subunit TsaD [Hyphobacterium sp. CCMP332]|nr:tRNA (adenosine(37)-N6)-threonylcarbamoyltransferase complex transferase subunit TsaD [Hyphobacterium sp. CCMP332]
MNTIILAIESSCDETSASIISNAKVLSNIIADQDVHKRFGGVVPELASRAHLQNIIPVVHQAISVAKIDKTQIQAIAFTRGPGLMGPLLVGLSFAKSMALSLNIPLIEVNHMQAHVLAHFIEDPKPSFPFICLTVSGGHTQLVLVEDHLNMKIAGQTLDDAVGEAFDKAAKLLGLGYPGGPEIDKHAALGDSSVYSFPISDMPDYNFSFSGIKTSLLYFLQKNLMKDPDFIKSNLNDICASYQKTLIDSLMQKLEKLAEDKGIGEIAIAGGVSANKGLRMAIQSTGNKKSWNTYIPDFQYCTDNAAMIAMAAHYKFLKGEFSDQAITPLARLSI